MGSKYNIQTRAGPKGGCKKKRQFGARFGAKFDSTMSSGSRYRRPQNSSLFVRGLNLSTT